jgi:putative aminopeptidase FrvX
MIHEDVEEGTALSDAQRQMEHKRLPHAVDADYIERVLLDLCRIPSPTGMTAEAIAYVEREFAALGIQTRRTRKGALIATLEGADGAAGHRTLSAHVDTLGAMVAYIKETGRLQLSMIGGYAWNAIEGEYCIIHTQDDRRYTGTVMVEAASNHVHGERTGKSERSAETMEVRIDARTRSAEDTRALGIEVGDFVSLEPRATIAGDGFIKSRHLDDKACVACVLGVARALSATKPAVTTHFFISNYEEVGHGASAGIPPQTEELIAVDMAAIGHKMQTSDEFSVTICVKDSSGPYDHALSSQLRQLATQHGIPFKVDIYRYYSSDASAALRAGGEFRAALIGPGVDASHSFERTHRESLVATTQLCLAYLQQ